MKNWAVFFEVMRIVRERCNYHANRAKNFREVNGERGYGYTRHVERGEHFLGILWDMVKQQKLPPKRILSQILGKEKCRELLAKEKTNG